MKLIIRFLIVFAIIESCQNSIRLDQSQIKTFDLTKRADISFLKLSDLGFIDIEYKWVLARIGRGGPTIKVCCVGWGFFG